MTIRYDIPERSDEWHALRAANVGGSESAALWGMQAPYQASHFSLWQAKSGRIPHPTVDGERIEAGIWLEPVIGRWAAERRGWTIRKGGFATDDTTPGLSASIDYEIATPGPEELALGDPAYAGPGVLELKNVDGLVWRRTWTEGQPPFHILLQHQHQLCASGFTWGAIVALVGGNDLRIHPYAARPKLHAAIRERVTAFWRSVAEDRPPPIDDSERTAEAVRAMFPVLTDEEIDLSHDTDLSMDCFSLLAATADRQTGAKIEQGLKSRIYAKLGTHRRAVADGYWIKVSVTPAREGRAESRKIILTEQKRDEGGAAPMMEDAA